MFQYTINTLSQLPEKMAVSLDEENELTLQSNKPACGLCVSSTYNSEINAYENLIYVAGGSGTQAELGVEWDGKLTRFIFTEGYVFPVTLGGLGWILPESLSQEKNKDDIVQIVLYK
jgi:hypothetical protein